MEFLDFIVDNVQLDLWVERAAPSFLVHPQSQSSVGNLPAYIWFAKEVGPLWP